MERAVALDLYGRPLRLSAPWWFWTTFGEQGVFLLSRAGKAWVGLLAERAASSVSPLALAVACGGEPALGLRAEGRHARRSAADGGRCSRTNIHSDQVPGPR